MFSTVYRSFLSFFLILFSVSSWSSNELEHSPPNFEVQNEEIAKKLVFVDFSSAQYKIEFDFEKKEALVRAEIEFYQDSAGFPLFDLVSQQEEKLTIEDEEIAIFTTKSPDKVTTLRFINKKLTPGNHRAVITYKLARGVTWLESRVELATWLNDFRDRHFLEQYFPSNLQYDSFPMEITVDLGETSNDYDVISNGVVTREIGSSEITTILPDFMNTSAVFYHLFPKDKYPKKVYQHKDIPVIIYGDGLTEEQIKAWYKKEVRPSLSKVVKRFGEWPHSKLIIYSETKVRRAMEYAGAMRLPYTQDFYHELVHSYIGRSVFPIDGDASWFDEAFTTWIVDGKAKSRKTCPKIVRPLGKKSPYFRVTNQESYSTGSQFIAYLAGLMKEKGLSMKKEYFKNISTDFRHQKVTTDMIANHMSEYYGESLIDLFNSYVYQGTNDTCVDIE